MTAIAHGIDARVRLLWDKTNIADVAHRYAEATDSGDFDALRSVFHDDVCARYAGFDEMVGADCLLDWIRGSTGDYDWQHHLLTPYEVRVNDDEATVTVYHTSHQTGPELPGGRKKLVGIYRMRMRRDEGYDLGWRIAELELEIGVRQFGGDLP